MRLPFWVVTVQSFGSSMMYAVFTTPLPQNGIKTASRKDGENFIKRETKESGMKKKPNALSCSHLDFLNSIAVILLMPAGLPMPIHTSAALRLILAPLINKYFIHSASMAQRQDGVWISVRQLRTARSCFAVYVTAIWLLISSVTVPHSMVILSVTQVLKLNACNSLNQTIFGHVY